MKAQCQVLISPIRAEISEKSEMISQILYGETCEILENSGSFSKIKVDSDGTVGWTNTNSLTDFTVSFTKFIVEEPFGIYDLKEGRSLLSIGSEVDFEPKKIVQTKNLRGSIAETAKKFLNVPFLWGGRSFFGVDADGFVQLVFKVHGIKLPRKAEQMAELGKVVDFLGESDAGDLAFFDDEEGNISHVGIMLNAYEVIHSYGKVRVDALDSSGIYNSELKKHTHRLRFVKSLL